MTYMLDTNICIYAIKHSEIVTTNIYKYLSEGICISSITLAELEFGVANSQRRLNNRQALINFLTPIAILPFDPIAATEYGDIRAYLRKKGTPIGELDMLIAAHARANGFTIVTNNEKEFRRVPNLNVVNWI